MKSEVTAIPRGADDGDDTPEEDLEILADALILSSGQDQERPAYTETQFRRKCRRSERDETRFVIEDATTPSELMDSEMEEMASRARLSGEERLALSMYVREYTTRQIAVRLGVARPTAVRLIRTAMRRVARCRPRYRGLYAV